MAVVIVPGPIKAAEITDQRMTLEILLDEFKEGILVFEYSKKVI